MANSSSLFVRFIGPFTSQGLLFLTLLVGEHRLCSNLLWAQSLMLTLLLLCLLLLNRLPSVRCRHRMGSRMVSSSSLLLSTPLLAPLRQVKDEGEGRVLDAAPPRHTFREPITLLDEEVEESNAVSARADGASASGAKCSRCRWTQQ